MNKFLDAAAKLGGIVFVLCMLVMVIVIFYVIVADSLRKHRERVHQRKADMQYVHELFQNVDYPQSPSNDQQFFENVERAQRDFN